MIDTHSASNQPALASHGLYLASSSQAQSGGRGCVRPLLIGLGIGMILIILLALAAVIILPLTGFRLNLPGAAPATMTQAPLTETPLPTDIPAPTATPETPPPLPTETPAATETATPTPTLTPPPTDTPTITPSPTEDQLLVSAKSQAFCRYGPGTAFLPNVDIFQGDTMAVNGRYQYGGWIWVKPEKSDRSCWIASSLVDPAVDPNALPIIDYSQLLPITNDIAPPGNVTAVRNGDTVTISWDPINVTPSGARGYLVDVFVCQNGAYIKYITNTDNTSINITDQKNTCAGPSGGVLYGAAATGYTQPVTIVWP